MAIFAEWTVVPAPEPVFSAVSHVSAKPVAAELAHPLRRAQTDFETRSGDAAVLAQVAEVLGTDLGSLPWRTDFGCDLQRLRQKGNTPILRETARAFIDDAIRKWVPSASLVSVDVKTPAPNAIDLFVIVQIGTKQQSLTQRL